MKNPHAFLGDKYWNNPEFRGATQQASKRTRKREDRRIPNEPEALTENYLKRFTDVFEREDEQRNKRGIEAMKRLLYRNFIVKPENITDDYIKGVFFGNYGEQKGYHRGDLKNPEVKQGLVAQFLQEKGISFEEYEISQEEKARMREMAIKDQESRLESWFSYLTSPEAENVPAAYRYWAFAEMLKLGSYDDDRKVYNTRTETTAANFPELDQQALALVLDEIRKQQQGEPSGVVFSDEQRKVTFKKSLKKENFGKLYASVQEHLKTLRLPTERLVITQGEWRVFPKGSDPKEVVRALEGYHTQWCIAGEGTAAGYLAHSDLHIYFSQDENTKNIIPRACVVDSTKGQITEVRGIMSNESAKQHLDDYITPVVDEHLASLPGGEQWQRQMRDMKHLASIHLKHSQQEELSKNDLRFLYEIDGKIQSTGYQGDPRIAKIRAGRGVKNDLSSALGVPKEQISCTETEAIKGNIKYHYGDLYLSGLTSAEGLSLPESVSGGLNLSGLTSAEGLTLPESVGGDLYLSGLTSAKGLTLPKSVGGILYLSGLTSAEGLTLPESVGGDLYLSGLTSAEGITLPESVGGDLYLNGLTSAEGLKLPESVRGSVYISRLTLVEKNSLRRNYPNITIM